MEFSQLIESNNRYIFLQKSCRKSGREACSRPLFFFGGKTLYEVKANGLELSFNIS